MSLTNWGFPIITQHHYFISTEQEKIIPIDFELDIAGFYRDYIRGDQIYSKTSWSTLSDISLAMFIKPVKCHSVPLKPKW